MRHYSKLGDIDIVNIIVINVDIGIVVTSAVTFVIIFLVGHLFG